MGEPGPFLTFDFLGFGLWYLFWQTNEHAVILILFLIQQDKDTLLLNICYKTLHFRWQSTPFLHIIYACLPYVMATHSSILAWRIPWTEEPGGLQSMGSQRVGHDWMTSLSLFHFSTLISRCTEIDVLQEQFSWTKVCLSRCLHQCVHTTYIRSSTSAASVLWFPLNSLAASSARKSPFWLCIQFPPGSFPFWHPKVSWHVIHLFSSVLVLHHFLVSLSHTDFLSPPYTTHLYCNSSFLWREGREGKRKKETRQEEENSALV